MNNVLKSLRTMFTGIGGSLPTANPVQHGMLALKRAASTEDEAYLVLRDSSGVLQFRRLVTSTLGDADYVNVTGDTMTGALIIDVNSDTAFVVRQADDTKAFEVDTNGTKVVRILNSTSMIGYSDNATTSNYTISSATGTVNLFNGGDLAIWSDNGVTQKALIDGATGNTTLAGQLTLGAGTVEIVNVTGTPESATSAPDGSIAMRDDGAANTTVYFKQTGTGNTGWVPVNAGLTFTLGPFFAYNTAISTTAQMQILEPTASGTQVTTARDFEMKSAGRVVGGFLNGNNARTAGTATLAVRVNGTPTNLTAVLNATDTQFTSAFVNHSAGVSFAAGDSVGAAIVTDGSWAPTTTDFNAYLVISLDPFV